MLLFVVFFRTFTCTEAMAETWMSSFSFLRQCQKRSGVQLTLLAPPFLTLGLIGCLCWNPTTGGWTGTPTCTAKAPRWGPCSVTCTRRPESSNTGASSEWSPACWRKRWRSSTRYGYCGNHYDYCFYILKLFCVMFFALPIGALSYTSSQKFCHFNCFLDNTPITQRVLSTF